MPSVFESIVSSPGLWGLAGVILGSALTIFKDIWLNNKTQSLLRAYASIRLFCVLNHFIDNCVEVVRDEGSCETQDHGQEERYPNVGAPTKLELPLDIDWKSLEPDFLYQILSLPTQLANALNSISGISDIPDEPPDHEVYFNNRAIEFSRLGLIAYELAETLRRTQDIPNLQRSIDPRDVFNSILRSNEVQSD